MNFVPDDFNKQIWDQVVTHKVRFFVHEVPQCHFDTHFQCL